MTIRPITIISTLYLLLLIVLPSLAIARPPVIVSDSSSHYLPPNSLPAIAVAIARGAESVQLELVMSKDRQIIVLKDTKLNDITNVQDIYPGMAGEDGSFQSFDFTLDEIKGLSLVSEDTHTQQNDLQGSGPVVPFIHIATLQEMLGTILVMEQKLGHEIGIIAEIKKNWLHLQNDLDISREVLTIFKQYNLTGRKNTYLASYDPEELRRIKNMLPALEMDTNTLQLIDTNKGQETMRFERGKWFPYNYDWLLTKFGLKALSSFANAIGLKPDMVINKAGGLKLKEYTEDAHMLGLDIFAYPFDPFSNPLPEFTMSTEDLAEYCLSTAGFDAILTRNDEKIRRHLAEKLTTESSITDEKPKTSIEKLLENLKHPKNR